jgi:hypothetical protein
MQPPTSSQQRDGELVGIAIYQESTGWGTRMSLECRRSSDDVFGVFELASAGDHNTIPLTGIQCREFIRAIAGLMAKLQAIDQRAPDVGSSVAASRLFGRGRWIERFLRGFSGVSRPVDLGAAVYSDAERHNMITINSRIKNGKLRATIKLVAGATIGWIGLRNDIEYYSFIASVREIDAKIGQ